MGRLNWDRAKSSKPTADAIGEGFVRNDGRVTPVLPKDGLAKRAAKAEARWLKENGLQANGSKIFRSEKGRRHG